MAYLVGNVAREWDTSPPQTDFLVGAELLGFLRPQHTGTRPSPQLASCMLLPLGPQAPT